MSRSIDEIVESMKLLGDKSRLTILALLKERELCVCDIAELLDTTQPNVSQHLRKLKKGGLVVESRKAQWIYYSLNIEDKDYLHELLLSLPSMENKLELLSKDNNRCI
ncbi:ArsR/SmtB family transcription factor [Paenibacillus paeoniae]|uniref:ArsR family transcriptional regulator n=1 Tax=Paenibacillus paeoniae TaxID=2292705 RepID=A0A371PL33_9BACL|nr:metalloregulator ArsR/SmtB family transcription factor [Paenibacillus paeoniae]REK76813.1 ArsR family transcriptional regulator [Paenibacillus paeoniae]